jgi:alkylhydroperoxidase family enzyme
MTRLPLVAVEDPANDDVRGVFADFIRDRGRVPNAFRVWAHAPDVLSTLVSHYRTLMASERVPRKIKQLVLLEVSRVNRCRY